MGDMNVSCGVPDSEPLESCKLNCPTVLALPLEDWLGGIDL